MVFKDYEKHFKSGIPSFVYQFFDCLLWQFTLTGAKTTQIRLPLDDYMNMRGLKDVKTARQTVLDSIDILKKIEYDVFDKVNSKSKTSRRSGSISIYGGTGFIRNSVIYFDFNQYFYESLHYYSPMDVPKQALLINTHRNPNSFHFLKYISVNYRLNEGKKRQDIISMSTLISKSPSLPTYNEVMEGDRALNRRIVQPTFRDLDLLDAIKYTVHSPDGTDITEKCNKIDYEDFINSKIKIDYSQFPTHSERSENRRQHIETAKKRKSTKRK